MKTYRVKVIRSGNWWAIEIPQVKGAHSQARHLGEVEAMARDVIALMLEVPEDSFDIEVNVVLDKATQDALKDAQIAEAQATAAKRAAWATKRRAARSLVRQGLSARDAGTVLGISKQRVSQLVAGNVDA